MKAPPTDPIALQAHVIDTMCADLAAGDFKHAGFRRTEALRSVVRQRSDTGKDEQ